MMKKTLLASAVLMALATGSSMAAELTSSTTTPVGIGEFVLNEDVQLTTNKATLMGVRSSNTTVDGTIVALNGHTLELESTDTGNSYNGVVVNTTISGQGAVVINQNGKNNALGYGSTSIAADAITISSKLGSAVWNDNGKHTLDGNGNGTIKLISKDGGHGIYVAQKGAVEIKNFKELVLESHFVTDDGYAISNNGGNVKIHQGGKITLSSGKRGALASISANASTEIAVDEIEISSTITGQNETRKMSTIFASAGALSIKAKTLTVNVELGEGQTQANAIGMTGGALAIDVDKSVVNGDIDAAAGEMKLDGEMVFNGDKAVIDNLSGDQATLTLTNADQEVAIGTNNNKELTLAAGGDMTIEQLADAVSIDDGAEGVKLGVAEGKYLGAVSGVLGADGKLDAASIKTEVNSIMSNTLDLAASAPLAMNRMLMNDVRKRLGNIRSAEGTHGVWARYDGGRLSGAMGLENDFHTLQFGIDTVPAADAPRFGVAFSYTQSDADMKRGGAEMDAFGLAAYATKMYDNGAFVDVIGRIATADSDLVIDGENKGSMDNLAISLSAEAGWRFAMTERHYVEPQVEVTYTRINNSDLTLSNDAVYGFDNVDSVIGRVGFAAGFTCPNKMGDVYVRASVVREFMGDATVRGGDVVHGLDGADTWYEYGIGANFNLNKNTYVYADVERTSGGVLDEDWRANVGVRYSF